MALASELAALQELTSLSDATARDAFLDSREDLLRPAVVVQIAEAVRQHVRVDTHEALCLAEAGVAIAAKIQHGDSQALASRAKANALYMLGQNQPAVELHDLAIALFQESGNERELGRSLSASLQPLALLGHYDRAFANAERARTIFAQQGDSLRLARLDINFGNILHRQDRFKEALDCYRRALDELWPDKDVEGVAVVLHNIAVCLIGLNDFRKATDAHVAAREFCDQHKMPLLVLQADYNIAALYHQRGEYGRAMRRLRESRAICQTIGDEHHQALCQLDLSDIYLELNLLDEAAVEAGEAFERFERLAMGYEAAKCLANRAVSLSRQQRYTEAVQLFTRAREMFVSQQNRAWPFLIDLYQAMLYVDTHRLEEAGRLCEGALGFFRESAIPTKAVLCDLLLARIASENGAVEEASRRCRDGLQRAEDLDITSLKHQSHALLGHLLEGQGRFSEAWEAYEAAHLETETLRNSLGNEEMKIAFMANKFDVYERLVALSIQGAAPHSRATPVEMAFEFIEEGKSRALRDSVFGRAHSPECGRSGSGTSHRGVELRQELNWYRHQLEQHELGRSPASRARLHELQEQIRIREREFQRLIREDPASVSDVKAARVATIDEVRAVLAPNACLIEYFRLGDQLVAILVTPDDTQWIPICKVGLVEAPLRLLRFQFQTLRVTENAGARAAASLPIANHHLRSLYDALIAPLRPYIDAYGSLAIVPHDVLHSVPFHALFDGERYLIDSFAVSYAPSASMLAFGHTEPRARATRALILGVPDQKAPRIEDEVQAISALLPDSVVFMGECATTRVLRELGPDSRFIHIASHGLFRPDSPMFSGVRLGDEYLDVYDLYQLTLPCELITLSGCGTGMNVLQKGDELLGLQRGLLLAGARCVLLTMWDIDDASTSLLMPLFYRGLQQHGDKVEALREAQASVRTSYPHPYHWAAFVLAGDPAGGRGNA